MNFLIHDKEILNKYNKICDKIKNLFEKKHDSDQVDNDKHIKTKSSLYNMKRYCNKIPKENEYYTY